MEDKQVVAGEVIDDEASDGVEDERSGKVEGGDEHFVHGEDFAFIDYPAEEQEKQPNDFGGKDVCENIAELKSAVCTHK